MPKRPTAGTMQFGLEMNAELVDEWREFCRTRGGVRYQTEMALRRHMDNPPADPPPLPPYPPAAPEPEPKKKPRKGAKS